MNNKSHEPVRERNKPFEKLKPIMKEMLMLTAKTTWKMMKLMVKAAYHIPGAVRKMTLKSPEPPAKEKVI